MAVKRAYASFSCVDAARQRVQNVFDNGLPVYMSLSGGKDSICMADVVYKLIQAVYPTGAEILVVPTLYDMLTGSARILTIQGSPYWTHYILIHMSTPY